jgi:broad specificity phosphatase PhoE
MLSAMDRSIFIIRHGEKPPPGHGVELDGKQDEHSLLPVGWQRAGALATFFSGPRAALAAPTQLIAPRYAKHGARERTHETIAPLAALLGLHIETPFEEGEEAKLAAEVAAADEGVTLICWEHKHLPSIAESIPTPAGTTIPSTWPADRFDIVFCFARDDASGVYDFSQLPQMLLAGDLGTPIAG